MRSKIFNFHNQKKPFVLFSLASANKIQMHNWHLPTEDLCLRVMVATLKFSNISQNPAEQANTARKKDMISKHISNPEEVLECLKPCLVLV